VHIKQLSMFMYVLCNVKSLDKGKNYTELNIGKNSFFHPNVCVLVFLYSHRQMYFLPRMYTLIISICVNVKGTSITTTKKYIKV